MNYSIKRWLMSDLLLLHCHRFLHFSHTFGRIVLKLNNHKQSMQNNIGIWNTQQRHRHSHNWCSADLSGDALLYQEWLMLHLSLWNCCRICFCFSLVVMHWHFHLHNHEQNTTKTLWELRFKKVAENTIIPEKITMIDDVTTENTHETPRGLVTSLHSWGLMEVEVRCSVGT